MLWQQDSLLLMRKISIFLICFFLFVIASSASLAQTETPTLMMQAPASASASNPPSVTKESDYQLPYPGLLPDSPLYFLKTFRDKIVSFLISDPSKRAEFDVLQADKRLAASLLMLDSEKGKEALAVSTISKGENYFEDALSNAKQAKKEGTNSNDIKQKLITSSQKHEEVLKQLEKTVQKPFKRDFTTLIQRMDKIEDQVNQL